MGTGRRCINIWRTATAWVQRKYWWRCQRKQGRKSRRNQRRRRKRKWRQGKRRRMQRTRTRRTRKRRWRRRWWRLSWFALRHCSLYVLLKRCTADSICEYALNRPQTTYRASVIQWNLQLVFRKQDTKLLGLVFPCTFNGQSNLSLINSGTWLKIISVTFFHC